ncbi:hypothetical protein J3A83DRAFT_4053373, partial [Scleroderma citrinum]
KMHYYIKGWGIDMNKNVVFIHNTIHQVIRYSFGTILRKSSNKVAKASGGRCNVQRTHVSWLGIHAFHSVFSRKPQKYASCSLLEHLEFELSLPRNKKIRKRFRKLVKESM